MSMATIDSTTGNWVHVTEHTLDNLAGDIVYYTVAVYTANQLGATEWPSMIIPGNSQWAEAMRYAVFLGGLMEVRKFIEMMGGDTNIFRMLRRWW